MYIYTPTCIYMCTCAYVCAYLCARAYSLVCARHMKETQRWRRVGDGGVYLRISVHKWFWGHLRFFWSKSSCMYWRMIHILEYTIRPYACKWICVYEHQPFFEIIRYVYWRVAFSHTQYAHVNMCIYMHLHFWKVVRYVCTLVLWMRPVFTYTICPYVCI